MPMKVRSVVPSKAGVISNLAGFKGAAILWGLGVPKYSFPLTPAGQVKGFGKALKFVENLIDIQMYLWYPCSSFEK
jgi:hypothetical protein